MMRTQVFKEDLDNSTIKVDGDKVVASLPKVGGDIDYTPDTSGNTDNLNQIVTDPDGQSWFIDHEGNAQALGSASQPNSGAIYKELLDGEVSISASETSVTLNDELSKYSALVVSYDYGGNWSSTVTVDVESITAGLQVHFHDSSDNNGGSELDNNYLKYGDSHSLIIKLDDGNNGNNKVVSIKGLSIADSDGRTPKAWTDITSDTVVDTEYTNDTGYEIIISATTTKDNGLSKIALYVDNILVAGNRSKSSDTDNFACVQAPVPNGSTWKITSVAGDLTIAKYA